MCFQDRVGSKRSCPVLLDVRNWGFVKKCGEREANCYIILLEEEGIEAEVCPGKARFRIVKKEGEISHG